MAKTVGFLLSCLVLMFGAISIAQAHNNPTFAEVFLRSIQIEPGAPGQDESEPFVLQLPERSAQLIWKVSGENPDQVRFSLSADGQIVAENLQSGARSKLFRGKNLAVVDVQGTLPVTIEIYVSVIAQPSS